jgi:spermidine synthase
MTARTFLDAFPRVMLWLPSIRDAVLIGSVEPLRLDVARLEAAWADPRTRQNLEQAYLETPEALLATFLLEREGVERWAGDAPTITDERPLMEFFRHQGRNMTDAEIATLLEPRQGAWRPWVPALDDERIGRIREENRALRLHVEGGIRGDGGSRAAAAALSRSTEFFLHPFGCATSQIEALHAMAPQQVAAQRARCGALRR